MSSLAASIGLVLIFFMEFYYDGYEASRCHLLDLASACFDGCNFPVSPKWVSHILSTVTRLGEFFWMFVGDSDLINQHYL